MATRKTTTSNNPAPTVPYIEPTMRDFAWEGFGPPTPLPTHDAARIEIIREPHHRPFVAMASLRDGIVSYGEPLHLDGILQWAMIKQHEAHGGALLPPDPNAMRFPLDIPAPLARWRVKPLDGERPHPMMMEGGHLWGWCASAHVCQVAGLSQIETRKRTPTAAMALWGKDKSVTTAAGPDKPWDLSRPLLLPTRGQVCWFGLGDVERVRDLLRAWVHSVGKLRTQGNGALREPWRVEEIGQDFSCFLPDGRPTRTLPAGAVRLSLPIRDEAIRAPYWHASRVVQAVRPSPLVPEMMNIGASPAPLSLDAATAAAPSSMEGAP